MTDSKDILKICDAFYSRFILRDFFGKIIPGSLFLITASFSIITIEHAITFYDYLKEFWIWVIFIGISWLIGFAIQGIGTKEIRIKNNEERKNYQLIRMYPKKYSYEEGEKLYNKFKDKCSDDKIKRQHERYVVIKEACGNGGASLSFAFIILLSNIIMLSIPSIEYENLLSYYFENNILGIVILMFFLLVLIIGLFIMNRIGAKYQMDRIKEIC